MNTPDPSRMDRRLAIKWMLTASAGAMLVRTRSLRAQSPDAARSVERDSPKGYGTDPDLMKVYKPGDFWPLTFSDAKRRQVAALSDIIIPADADSASASSVGVTDFVDEWISAPYPDNVRDRKTVLEGLLWLDAESSRRFSAPFAELTDAQRHLLCEEISVHAGDSAASSPHVFFRVFRNLVASGYYTTPVGMKAIGYVGNVPLARFDGPPADLVAKLGLTDEVKW